ERAMRDVPPGSQFLLLRRMICLDADLNPVPTRLVETVQVRLYRPSEIGKPNHVFEEFELDRRLLFAGRQGGFLNVPEGTPRPRAYEALGRLSTDPEGRVVPLIPFPRNCSNCHSSQNFQTFVVSLSGGSRAGRPDPRRVDLQTTQWKISQEDYTRLRELASTLDWR
ncbi:MAG: hypothetical protein L0170_17100, partial [Acidobacteria bacterium]|nr:hypothetical protein [Acidobacteriota bacterium]